MTTCSKMKGLLANETCHWTLQFGTLKSMQIICKKGRTLQVTCVTIISLKPSANQVYFNMGTPQNHLPSRVQMIRSFENHTKPDQPLVAPTKVAHLGCAAAFWVLGPHPLCWQPHHLFWGSVPDGLKPAQCGDKHGYTSINCNKSQQNPGFSRCHATTCHLCLLLEEPWGCLLSCSLPELWNHRIRVAENFTIQPPPKNENNEIQWAKNTGDNRFTIQPPDLLYNTTTSMNID